MRLYNTPVKSVVDLQISPEKPVSIYTCGPTVYDYPHIGNWYTFIRYDLLNRVLKVNGFETHWVMNITDVGHLVSDADEGEDKLEKGAKREGKTAWDIAKFYSDYFIDGLKRLNFSPVTKITKATDYIPQQIELVRTLDEKGFTYRISDGVYFDTSKFPNYAQFAHLNLGKQEEGARVEVNHEKRNPSDFALWKFSPEDQKRDMEWESPWGIGFPGWHLECSAMIHAEFTEPIDIHAGGIDHIPIHHTNEMAQTEAAYGVELAKVWMHCNHILVDGKKMAKSAGNFYTLEDIEAKGFSLEVFRLHILSSHYRSQSEFSWHGMESTRSRLQGWIDTACLRWQSTNTSTSNSQTDKERLLAAVNDDLNTAQALSVIDSLSDMDTAFLNFVDDLFGTNLVFLSRDLESSEKELFEKRKAAKDAKDFVLSDSLRNELDLKGIIVRDMETGQVWSRKV